MNEYRITVAMNGGLMEGGKEYVGYIASITDTFLGVEDHGVLTGTLTIKRGGTLQTIGGYFFDQYNPETEEREVLTFGMDFIRTTLSTVGVSSWEALKGQTILLLGDSDRNVVGIANIWDPQKVFIFKDLATMWDDRVENSKRMIQDMMEKLEAAERGKLETYYYVSQDLDGDTWSVYAEDYIEGSEEPIDGSQRWVSSHPTQDEAINEAQKLRNQL